MDATSFKHAMRHCAGTVALVTVGRGKGHRTGLTVTAVCSLTDQPPSLLVCINRNASAHPRIREERAFAVNFLTTDHIPLALAFSGQKGVDGDDRFAFGTWDERATGTPVLADAIAAFDCELTQTFDASTHTIFVGEVRETHVRPVAKPLVYMSGGFLGVHEIQDIPELGDIDARKLSWSLFS